MSETAHGSIPGSMALWSRLADRGGLLVFLGIGTVYLLTLSHNLSIAHDSVEYSARILSLSPVYHPNHLLYEPLLSSLLRVFAAIGIPGSVSAIEAIGAVAGAATMAAAYKTLVERFGVSRRNAALAVVACAASYGPWYYSVAVEIYIFPLSALAWCLYVLLGARGRIGAVAVAAVLHSVAILLHQTSILFALVPILVVLGEPRRSIGGRLGLLSVYVLIGTVLVAGPYAAVAFASERVTDVSSFITWFLGYGAGDLFWSPASPKALVLALVGFGRAVIGGHFVFGLAPLGDALQALFKDNDLADEAYLLHQVPAGLIWLLLTGTIVWGGLFLWTVVSLVRAGVTSCRAPSDLLLLLAWFVPYAVFFTVWNAGNVDFWVNQVFVGWMIVAVLVDRLLPTRTAGIRLGALALGLVAINGGGTILPATDEANDFYTMKVLTLTAPMPADGVVVIVDAWPEGRHIRFRTDLEVIELARWRGPGAITAVLREHLTAGRQVYLWSDVFNLNSSTTRYYGPNLIESVQNLRAQLCGTQIISTFAESEAHEITCLR